MSEWWAISEKRKRLAYEKKLAMKKEVLKLEVKAEFTREMEIELKNKIYAEMVEGFKRAKATTNFSPRNELGVILLFGKYCDYLGFEVLDIHAISPDCDARKGHKNIKIEFEFKASNFIVHGHNPKKCDLVVCWEKDVNLPIEVLELKSALAHFITHKKQPLQKSVK